MEMVIELQEKLPKSHVVWESDDEYFALTAYELHPACFLKKNDESEYVITAITNIQRGKYHAIGIV